MTELTDLEICKKIAEIEGLTLSVDWLCDWGGIFIVEGVDLYGEIETVYDPFNRAVCFDLMVKYAVELQNEMNGEYHAYSRKTGGSSYNASPVKAILLAIIGDDND